MTETDVDDEDDYRVIHLVMQLGLVDFDFHLLSQLLSPFYQIPISPKSGRQLNIENPSQPNPGAPPDESPCRVAHRSIKCTIQNRVISQLLQDGATIGDVAARPMKDEA